MRNVILADNAGFCFGVERAVEEAIKVQKQYDKKVYTLGPLIHNDDVVNFLEKKNVFSIDLSNINELKENDVIIIRSHGVTKNIMEILASKKFIIIDATCPFVTNIQKKVAKFYNENYKIVILGDEKHPEVIGINGWCDDSAFITKDGITKDFLPNKICVVSQTTEKQDNFKNTIANLSIKSKEMLAFNTICSATEVRQKSVLELSKKVDFMIIIGGKNSSNSAKLFEIASYNCENSIFIENSSELNLEILNNINYKTIGISAGASTPHWVISEVVELIKGAKYNGRSININE